MMKTWIATSRTGLAAAAVMAGMSLFGAGAAQATVWDWSFTATRSEIGSGSGMLTTTGAGVSDSAGGFLFQASAASSPGFGSIQTDGASAAITGLGAFSGSVFDNTGNDNKLVWNNAAPSGSPSGAFLTGSGIVFSTADREVWIYNGGDTGYVEDIFDSEGQLLTIDDLSGAFTLTLHPTSVPEPMSMLLLASGLIGFGALRRCKVA
jgi:PEP-CTERM motif